MLFDSMWITYKTGDYKSATEKYGNPAPYFRKTFSLNGEVKKATLLASALGVFKIYLNGKAVADDYLSPGWVDYKKKLPFVRYDITDMLLQNNAVAAVLGDGWAVGHLGSTYAFRRNGYCDRIEFTALVRIEYADGRVEEIPTDTSWRASSGEIRRSDIYMGEYVDARLSLGDFSLYDYDDSEWDNPEESIFKFSRNLYLEETYIPPVVVKHTFKPELLRERNGAFLYDVTQNISGVLRCVFKGEEGTEIVIKHGELLSEGELYTENLRKAEATDTYILSGKGEETFRPLFTFHGFQYAEITVNGNAEIVDVTAEAMYTDLLQTGEFECDDQIATKAWQNALWGQRDNFLNVPTDCPQRDERLGWTGDAQVFCLSAMYNMNCKKFFEKYLADVRDAQLGNGVITAVAPVPPVGSYAYTGYDASAGWSEAIGEIPYQHYKMYGEKRVIRDNLPALKKLLDYYETESPEYTRPAAGRYGDWLCLGNPTSFRVVSTMYYARAAFLAAELCRFIGDFEEGYYRTLYENIKTAFRKKFITDDGKIVSDTQSAYVIAYSFGLIDIEEARENLVRKFEKDDDGKLTTGFLGIRFLLPTLCDIGRGDIAYHLITNKEYPGWGYSIVNGATTIWEHWDSYTEENGIKEGMNSFNHYSLGSCTEWMYEYCLGIKPDIEAPGFKKVKFAPVFDLTGKINKASGHYDTDHGRISVEWAKEGENFIYKVTCPAEIEIEFEFSNMEITDSKIDGNSYIFGVVPVK
ncbi:MAG: alpha-L-rhamnosidase [Ruminococcaceae bacterium]|nr:alpha-L-rhamnosidase [Oscillospiraceae bacterium]